MLVYNNLDKSEPSTFLKIIKKVQQEGSLFIVSPYIDSKILSNFLKNGTQVEIITNVDHLYKSVSLTEYNKIIDLFFSENLKVYNNNRLHAKAYFSHNTGLVGSANFTKRGFYENLEIGYYISQNSEMEVLISWYKKIKMHSRLLTPKLLKDIFVQAEKDSNRQDSLSRQRVKIKIKDKSDQLPFSIIEQNETFSYEGFEMEILETIRRFPDQKWLNEFFIGVGSVLSSFDWDRYQDLLCLTFTKYSFCITIGRRYSFLATTSGRLIINLPYRFCTEVEKDENCSDTIYFKSNGDIDKFQFLSEYTFYSPQHYFKSYKLEIIESIKFSINSCVRSPYKKAHKEQLLGLYKIGYGV